ncbi:unnamed protein product [Rotaria sp. Silwood1]|nr:unnamed protein product [Rotaria sp. Silwood1]CAF3683087.1 unnamed protein product [Rotaria sp. Silwood1]CAF4892829.1 unnamed protein product [Rotaria sp. Silwood1]
MPYPVYKLYRRRFYVLFIFSFLSFNQCLFWITFSPISNKAEKYYNINESTIEFFLAWGPILFIPCLPLSYLLLNRHNGLRYCVILLSIIPLIATIIRIIPSIIISKENPKFGLISLPFLHIGQILNAICGPLAMAPVSQLSCLWFDTNERTRATTVAIMSYNLGSTTGFILGPNVVYKPENIPYLLYIHCGLAFIACIIALIYFPIQPPTPPSPAAELLIYRPINEERINSLRSYIKSIKDCFRRRSFILLVISGGLIGGTYAAWTSLFDIILTPEGYTEKESGWIGFSSSIAEIIGGLCLSAIADRPRFHRSFKILILICFICYFISVSWFNLSIHTLFIDKSIIPSTAITLGISVTLAGLFQGGAQPLTYEALAEIMYPLPESLSASILVLFINIISLTLFFIARKQSKLMNFIILIILVICITLVLLTKFHYNRRDADTTRRSTLIPDDVDPLYNTNQIDSIENMPQINPISDSISMTPIIDTFNTNAILDVSNA